MKKQQENNGNIKEFLDMILKRIESKDEELDRRFSKSLLCTWNIVCENGSIPPTMHFGFGGLRIGLRVDGLIHIWKESSDPRDANEFDKDRIYYENKEYAIYFMEQLLKARGRVKRRDKSQDRLDVMKQINGWLNKE